jgi:hypothetical protein
MSCHEVEKIGGVMRLAVLVLLLVLVSGLTSVAQTRKTGIEAIEDIQLQVIEVSAKEEMAKLQVQQLDEMLKPENIERSLAGVGSTRPEELREQRKRQLTIEKTGAIAQLEMLTAKRTRLEAALAAAQVEQYQQSAKSPVDNAFTVELANSGWWLAMVLAALAALPSLTLGLLSILGVLNTKELRMEE